MVEIRVNMKVIKGKELEFMAANHEDPENPGVYKKVLVGKDDLVKGRVMMINWAKIPSGKKFEAHYHEDMEEVFVIVSGRAEIEVSGEMATLERGDAVIIPVEAIHEMKALGSEKVEYVALGVSLELGGRTVNV